MDYYGHYIGVGAQRGNYYNGQTQVYKAAVQEQTAKTVNLESNHERTRWMSMRMLMPRIRIRFIRTYIYPVQPIRPMSISL